MKRITTQAPLSRVTEALCRDSLAHGLTNSLLLSMTAASLGESLRNPERDSFRIRAEALCRGFFVWILLISGNWYFGSTAPTVGMDQEAYAKLALPTLFLAFCVGYSPHFFSQLFQWAEAITSNVEGEWRGAFSPDG